MTRFIALRTQDVGGSVQRPIVVDCSGVAPLSYRPVADNLVAADVAGRDVVLAIHGFNVSRPKGAISLADLDAALALGPQYRFFGVLWPGDFWLPVVNYPWGASIAVNVGRYLADYLNRTFTAAASVSVISHSLGGRVLLETAQSLDRVTSQLCITAGAVDRDCLDGQYKAVRSKAGRISVLSSRADKVLKIAYPAGDFISDLLLSDGDSPWRGALGLKGPKPPISPPVVEEAIPTDLSFDHGDYLPPGVRPDPPAPNPKWAHVADYMRRAVMGQPDRWT